LQCECWISGFDTVDSVGPTAYSGLAISVHANSVWEIGGDDTISDPLEC